MITEILAQIRAPNFTAGIVLFDDKVVETAPILRRMHGWSRDRARAACKRNGLGDHRGASDAARGLGRRSGLASSSMRRALRPCARVDNPGRRAVTGRLMREAAFPKTQAHIQSRTTGDSW